MKAADTDRSPGEPILLSQATLEQVLDAFLPEDPADATAAARVAARNAEGIEGLFGSETLDEVRDDLVIRPAPESPPWRTYFPREETESHGATEAMTSPATSGARRHIRWWPVAAAVAIGFAVGSLAIPPLFDRGPEVRPPSSVPAAGASEAASALPRATPAPARVNAAPEPRVTASFASSADPLDGPRPVAGAVLKGSLTADPKRARAPEPPIPPRPDGVKATSPIDSPAPHVSLPPPAVPAAQAAEPTPVPVADPAPPPSSAESVRNVEPASREPLPTSSATAPAAAVTTAAADTAGIEAVLSRYRQAFTALDADAARAVWPRVDARALGRAFDQLVEQQLDFQNCSITVDSAHATAACGGRARYVPKVGSRSVRDEPRQWTFSLQKANGQWLIERVSSR